MITVAAVPIVSAHFARSIAATTRFFEAAAPQIADCCRLMADRFASGGVLRVMGEGAQASDAQHVAVEFVHPVIVGKRALPAVAITSDTGVRSADIVLALCAEAVPPAIAATLAAARRRGCLTILAGGVAPDPAVADVTFHIAGADALVIQEVSETLYHVLWELVHVFFERGDAPAAALALGTTAPSAADLLAEVRASTVEKARDVSALRAGLDGSLGSRLAEAGQAMAARFRRGGTVLACGNGGSATDAGDVAADCLTPPLPHWRPLPAIALTGDVGVITAIGNDVGFDHVFLRQVLAFGRADDIAIAFTTSGASRNLLTAMTVAKDRGLLTIAMSGGDGGALARSASVDYCFTAPSHHLPRIQEAHATMWHALLGVVQEAMR